MVKSTSRSSLPGGVNSNGNDDVFRRPLLVLGLALIAAAVIGASISLALESRPVSGGPGGGDGWWGAMPHHSSGSVYGWMDDDRMMGGMMFGYESSGPPIAGATAVTVHAADFRFEPSRITVAVGEAVNLSLVNDDEIPHDLVIPSLGVAVDAPAGETATVGFTPDRTGTFEFRCSIPGHAAAGMTGTIEVTP